MTLAPLKSELPAWADAAADEATPPSIPKIAELGLLGTSVDTTVGIAVETDFRPTSPPNGDSETNVGVKASIPEVVEMMVEAPRLPIRALLFDAPVAVKAGILISVVLCMPAAEVEEA